MARSTVLAPLTVALVSLFAFGCEPVRTTPVMACNSTAHCPADGKWTCDAATSTCVRITESTVDTSTDASSTADTGSDSAGGSDTSATDAAADTADTTSDTAGDTAIADTGSSDTGSCKDRCGQYDLNWSCNCDDTCSLYEDCCSDYEALCGEPAADTVDTASDTTATGA